MSLSIYRDGVVPNDNLPKTNVFMSPALPLTSLTEALQQGNVRLFNLPGYRRRAFNRGFPFNVLLTLTLWCNPHIAKRVGCKIRSGKPVMADIAKLQRTDYWYVLKACKAFDKGGLKAVSDLRFGHNGRTKFCDKPGYMMLIKYAVRPSTLKSQVGWSL